MHESKLIEEILNELPEVCLRSIKECYLKVINDNSITDSIEVRTNFINLICLTTFESTVVNLESVMEIGDIIRHCNAIIPDTTLEPEPVSTFGLIKDVFEAYRGMNRVLRYLHVEVTKIIDWDSIVMTYEQQDMIHRIFIIENKWNDEIINTWKVDNRVKHIIGHLSTETIYNEGIRFKNEINEEIGLEVY